MTPEASLFMIRLYNVFKCTVRPLGHRIHLDKLVAQFWNHFQYLPTSSQLIKSVQMSMWSDTVYEMPVGLVGAVLCM